MLVGIKRRLKDMDTLRQVLLQAETCARAEGAAEPGSEHLVMAALKLPDNTVHRAFHRIGADPTGFVAAVNQQYADALRRVGVAVADHLTSSDALPARASRPGVFRSKPSVGTLVRSLARDRPSGSSRPLLGADIVLAALSSDKGTVARALAAMDVKLPELADACRLEIGTYE